MTQQEIIQKRDETVERLIADGWDYDDARFAAITAIKKPEGLLSEQPAGETHPALQELARLAAGYQTPVPVIKPDRVNSDDEMEDQ